MKICFATEVTYPNYCNRLQKSSLKDYFDNKFYEQGMYYYIATNCVSMFDRYRDNPFIKIFNVDLYRSDFTKSLQNEIWPENPHGIYPSKYHWNMRRFLLRQTAIDGATMCCYLDADVKFQKTIESSKIANYLVSICPTNTVATNGAIFKYSHKTPTDVFQHHEKYIKKFNLNFKDDQYDTIDGPVQIYTGNTSADLLHLFNVWNEYTEFFYDNEKDLQYGQGYANNIHSALSFAIPSANFKLIHRDIPFYPAHHYDDRY